MHNVKAGKIEGEEEAVSRQMEEEDQTKEEDGRDEKIRGKEIVKNGKGI